MKQDAVTRQKQLLYSKLFWHCFEKVKKELPHKFNLKRNLFYLFQTSSGSYISKESYLSIDFQKARIICLFASLKR